MTKWTAANLPDLERRTAIVTGATGGIGLIAARELARAGAHVVLAVRNVAKGAEVAASIADGSIGGSAFRGSTVRGSTVRGSTEVRELDVSSLESVRRFAAGWTGTIDILINNAGIMQVPLARTTDGFESQVATNYIGPFVLTNLLLPQITDRVVVVSSQLHRLGHVHLDDLNGERRTYNDFAAYADSKLDITLFSLELQRRLTSAGSSVRSMVAHPGIATTNLTAHRGGGINRFAALLNDPEHGALPLLFAATANIPGNSYVGPGGPGSIKGYPKVRAASRAARDDATATRLWERTAELTGVDFPLGTAVR
jgi:NAD(P)-dependent dehydrogenase (short-subunit alcohol dehydrogenase family)